LRAVFRLAYRQAEGLIDGTRKLQHLVIDLQRLLRKTEIPTRQREIAPMSDAGVFAYDRRPKLVARAIVKFCKSLGTTLARTGEIPAIETGHSSQKERLHQDPRIV
jgi:hypothetical protein